MREAVTRALTGTPVVAAYLLGSRAAGTAGAESDTDIACLLPRGVEGSLGLLAELTTRLADAGVPAPDVHVLNETPLAFQAEAVLRGQRLYSSDDEARVGYEVYVLTHYLDFEPILTLQYRLQRQRLARGESLARPSGR